ncbi:MAG: bifunctional dihydroorotate dehydrogenase B NAD binding subunit/NADPH-dependent glutamate synthase, partial [Muribaculaceae bacterium]|nr:bifunctional dihydroorotate dehydrogenase B NAD binding subunit/NADPH-dependent glutamate synthase [Muribaculaceae bacterium]
MATNRDTEWRRKLRDALPAKERTSIPRATMPMLAADCRIRSNEEVNRGLSLEQACTEATRCLDCPDAQCVTGCPVGIDIPGFIKNIQRGCIAEAAAVLRRTSALPAVCGRVCPQERQCESKCIYNKMKKEPVAIGWLERFAADAERDLPERPAPECAPRNGRKVAVAGSG